MNRDGKGHGISAYTKDYCVVDLETTGVYLSSAKIIELSAIKVRDNKIVDEFESLVNPGCHIPSEATLVNHITDEMVQTAPYIDGVIDSFIEFLGEDVIVGYNNASFDMNLLYDTVALLRRNSFSNNYVDVLHLARRCIVGVHNYKLETVSKYYSLDTEGEHRALKDCYLTKELYDLIYRDYS